MSLTTYTSLTNFTITFFHFTPPSLYLLPTLSPSPNMGNCFDTCNNDDKNKNLLKKSTAEIAPYDYHKSTTAVHLSGSPANPTTCFVHFACLYKTLSLHFTPTSSADTALQIASNTVSGSRELLLRFLDEKLPQPPLVVVGERGGGFAETTPWVVRMVALQHRSVKWHLGRVVRWGQDLVTRAGKRTAVIDPVMGSPKMEMKKFGKSYSQLLELMLDHARMEERVVFPLLEMADRGLCKVANEEHARDLPIMNGIKEDIKSVGVLDTGSSNYKEALSNLSARLKSLQEHCKEHFEEEERNVLPLIEALELSKDQQMRVLEQCFDAMQASHSHLFKFFIQGLQPQDAMQYLDLIIRCKDDECAASMLHGIIE